MASPYKRTYEIIPGLITWSILIGAVVFSFVLPLWVIYFAILFDLYWVFRVSYFVFYLSVSWRRFRRDMSVDWEARMREQSRWAEIYHLIFLPTAGEPMSVIRQTLQALQNTKFPKEKMLVVLAGEERKKEQFEQYATQAQAEFGSVFKKLFITIHPSDLSDEIPGKGSNLNYAGHEAQKMIDELGIPYENIVVSSFDVDTVVHPMYFAYLTYKYLTVPNPLRVSYQPVPLYNNNIWESPMIVRIAALSTTFWLLSELPRQERLCTFASHSMPFKALTDVGFWQKDIVTEDTRIFLQCVQYYNGDYHTEPLFIPVSMDAVSGASYIQSLKSLYKQHRRWAWGIEHFPYMAMTFAKNPLMPLQKKIRYFWNITEGMVTWATAPLLIFLLGKIPFWVGGEHLAENLAFQRAPYLLQALMNIAMFGIIVSIILTLQLLPPRPRTMRRIGISSVVLQWLFLPITLTIFGAIPAIDAQTRLMLGKHLGFNVTQKTRKKEILEQSVTS